MTDDGARVEAQALMLIGAYSRLQGGCEFLIDCRLTSLSPKLGAHLMKARLARLTDEERINAVLALAEDVGELDRFKHFRTTILDIKKHRDALGHSDYMFIAATGDSMFLMRAFKDGELGEVLGTDLATLEAKCEWADDLVTWLSDHLEYSVDRLQRADGTLLQDSPPVLDPADHDRGNPIVHFVIVDSGADLDRGDDAPAG